MRKTGCYTQPMCIKHAMGAGHAACSERLSAGFEAHREDDAWIAYCIRETAMRHAQGGYDLRALARSVEAHVRVLADI